MASIQLPTYIFGLIYQTFIAPLFDYCDVVWIPCLDKQFKAIAKEHIHSKVTSIVQHLRETYLHASFIHWWNVTNFIHLYKLLRRMAPLYLRGLFQYLLPSLVITVIIQVICMFHKYE